MNQNWTKVILVSAGGRNSSHLPIHREIDSPSSREIFYQDGRELLSAVSQNDGQAEDEGGPEESDPHPEQWSVQQISRPLQHRQEEVWLDRITGPEGIREVLFCKSYKNF